MNEDAFVVSEGSVCVQLMDCSSHVAGSSVIPTFTFRKPSTTISPEPPPNTQLELSHLLVSDVCRICQCGPNTLATPTPILLSPITSPKKRISTEDGSTASPAAIATTSSFSKSSFEPSPSCARTPQPDYNLISPCVCSGSLKYVHQCCLQNWIRTSNTRACEVCKSPFRMRSRFKPPCSWECVPMVPGEKKRIVCSALFHVIALACVVWSLYVLIDRTVEELSHGELEWQFWTKIIVEAIGCFGALVLTITWGKCYVKLLVRWIAYNRTFTVLGKEPPITVFIEKREPELINLIN